MGRNETIKIIRHSLRKRSGKLWSVRGGRGTDWGWIHVSAPPSRFAPGDATYMVTADRLELAQLMGWDEPVNKQGFHIPDNGDFYTEYADRAKGIPPAKIAQHPEHFFLD